MSKVQKCGVGLALMTGILIICLKVLQDKLFVYDATCNWAVGACLFFCLYEWIATGIVEAKNETLSPRQSVNLLMGLKGGKILLSLFFVLIYSVTVKIELKRFVLVFLMLYLIYLLFDTFYLISREKDVKKKKLLTKE